MKTLASSAPVLDEADDFSRKLDWILFKAEMEHIWGGVPEVPWSIDVRILDPETWVPGYPLYLHPLRSRTLIANNGCNCLSCVDIRSTLDDDGLEAYFRIGSTETVRWMVDIFDEYEFYEDCMDCEVSWEDPEELHCWMCGVQKKAPRMKSDLKPHYSTSWDGFTTVQAAPQHFQGQFVDLETFVVRIDATMDAVEAAPGEPMTISLAQRLAREDMVNAASWDELRHFSWELRNDVDDYVEGEVMSVRERALWARQNPSHAQFSQPITEQRRRRSE